MDRSVLGVLGPTLRDKVFHWTNEQYSWITISFQSAYAIGLLLMGGIIDKIGVRLGCPALVFGVCSNLTRRNQASVPVWQSFMAARALVLEFGEGELSGVHQNVAEWFPKRAGLCTGIFNAGSNVGAIMAPLVAR